MRLVLIGPVYPYRGGIAHYTTMLHQTLVEMEHTVLVVSFKRQYPPWLFPGHSDRDPSATALKVDPAHYWIDSLNPVSWLTAFWRIHRYQPDTLIMQWWTVFWSPAWFVLGVLTRLFLRRPLIYICHNVLPHELRWWDPWVARLVLCWGTLFVVHSAEEERRLLSLLPRARAVVVPLPVFDVFGQKQMSREDARRELGLPTDVPVLLFFGIVREYKGLKDLLAALPKIRACLGRVILLIAGEFWEDKQAYIDMIERLGISDLVVIDDRYIPNEEVSLYLSATDVLVAPYRQVTGSAVVQAARGFGVPVIATKICVDDPNLAQNGRSLLVPLKDPEALAEVVLHFFRTGSQADPCIPIMPDKGRSSWHDLVSDVIETCGAASPQG